jgi:hypothetical protein
MDTEPVVDEPVVEEPVAKEEESKFQNNDIEDDFQTSPKDICPDMYEVYGNGGGEHIPICLEENPLFESNKSAKVVIDESVAPVAPVAVVPKLIFVVPYRDRLEQYQFFDDHMRTRILSVYEASEYLILYAHQLDDRPFNRGAMKNIGFLAGKAMFPNDYQNITFVFNDVDTMPYVKNFLNYQTWPGNVKHFYGYHFALGGIVSITGGDFERVNGYPNLFSWSSEDNTLQIRVLEAGLNIDRSQFYPIMDKHILQNKDGLHKVINRTEHERVKFGSKEGLQDLLNIGGLSYDYVAETGFVNVKSFSTGYMYNTAADKIHNIADGTKIFQDNVVMNKYGYKTRRVGMFSMRF